MTRTQRLVLWIATIAGLRVAQLGSMEDVMHAHRQLSGACSRPEQALGPQAVREGSHRVHDRRQRPAGSSRAAKSSGSEESE